MIVLTGGSSVFNRVWAACDKPIRDHHGWLTQRQLDINAHVGRYLVAHGLVNRDFGYIRLPELDLLVLQTRNFYKAPISDTKLTASLFKFIGRHDDSVVIKSPYPSDVGRNKQIERLQAIRRNIARYTGFPAVSVISSPYGDGDFLPSTEYPFIFQPKAFAKIHFVL